MVGRDLSDLLWSVGTAEGFTTGWTAERSHHKGRMICPVSTSSGQPGPGWLWYSMWCVLVGISPVFTSRQQIVKSYLFLYKNHMNRIMHYSKRTRINHFFVNYPDFYFNQIVRFFSISIYFPWDCCLKTVNPRWFSCGAASFLKSEEMLPSSSRCRRGNVTVLLVETSSCLLASKITFIHRLTMTQKQQ